jgi:hypothetical protein
MGFPKKAWGERILLIAAFSTSMGEIREMA